MTQITVKTPAGAAAPGIIRLAEPDLYFTGGSIIVDHGHTVMTFYIHLSRLLVKVGDVVEQGQPIGLVGMTGRATGPHLHLGLFWSGTALDVALVLPHEYLPAGEEIAAMFDDSSRIQITAGGKTRFDSVKAGLQLVKEECVIFVHDGVRCLISVPLIQRCYNQALLKGSAVPAVAATDSIRIGEEDNHIVANRQQVRIVQTPQTFLSNILLPAFEQSFDESFTDEATVVEKYGATVYLTEGDYNNIKITRPVDMMIAERIISERLLLK